MMTNQINMFQASLLNKRREISSGTDPLMMATVMINYLPKLQDFAEHTVFLKNDEKIIQRLIQFIKSIPFNNYGVHINKSDQLDAVKQYYEKLFIPIRKTIEKRYSNQMMPPQQNPAQNQQVPGAQQQMLQQLMQQGMQRQMQQLLLQQLQRAQITPAMSQQMSPGFRSVNKSVNQDESNKSPSVKTSSLFLTKAPSISSDNQVQKQQQISSSVQPRKLEFHHESFSEEPDQNFLKKFKTFEQKSESRRHRKYPRSHNKIEAVVSDILADEDPQRVQQLSRSLSRIASRKARKLAEFLADEERNEEYELQGCPYMYAPQYSPFSQNAMMTQQQTQLMQMIQMNNANQAQFNLQMAHQTQLLQQMKRKKRRDQK
ncbi:hypothetical protein M9Y10_006798 [Tritrichomonas musculus]|uniref:Uncharacterized protein n=1 Tax=Tritrichomonas musculus TaxID=1915356 RepID=A0ABR2JH76_9EUKA